MKRDLFASDYAVRSKYKGLCGKHRENIRRKKKKGTFINSLKMLQYSKADPWSMVVLCLVFFQRH